MSIPPQLIRVKRKRVEETPVQFLQLDAGQKRPCGGSWAYQRRAPAAATSANAAHPDRPVIHVSCPEDASPPTKKHHGARHNIASTAFVPSSDTVKLDKPIHVEPRRFRVSRSATLLASRSNSKRTRYSSAVFIEGTLKRKTRKPRGGLAPFHAETQAEVEPSPLTNTSEIHQQKQLKRPGTRSKAQVAVETLERKPFPSSLMNHQNENMDQVAAAMDQWVLDEIGFALHDMQQERPKVSKFKPKPPAKRFQERHPEFTPSPPPLAEEPIDMTMSDATDDDDEDDWVIEEYVRIPANSVALGVSPMDIGILVFQDEEENMLFFGQSPDDEDDLDEDDEDENAENHYTADYPEDEVDSDDEFGRQAYLYRNCNASDEEEYDDMYNSNDERDDEMVIKSDILDNDDAHMERIRAFMKRNSAFQ
ncbi:hypothetical protein DCS_04816 [Drechmeria coniospora]|uniref:Transcription factor Iwr1 domain-containing protein n=1 Tax=Drechmeria coniospora TaxID=98403 RepID=A0A151GL21_DRECN|nr:hypothetical protein DCS_04816 [Drechmeria coniospora]KYK57803.1 hypothetical protein DCS_04816 [Drechmeria coniospora]ODA82790.1 hypothetical protein RJ55_01299 [Drechmeria coniospora]